MFIYNTLSGSKEEFKPLEAGSVGIYNCGPTVYDSVHIGNLRTFVTYDIVRRVFEYEGYRVTQVMNITDVDDKTIKKSSAEERSLSDLTHHYENLFLSDINTLNILVPHKLLRASEHVKEMIDMVANLLEKGIAYPTKDGVYFSIGMFKSYGELARIKLDAEVRERIQNDEYEKENPRDFALWKFYKKEDGGVFWDAPFGKGRPGWSIECSAMAIKSLGKTIDVHAGGTDLIFPHHTNEIAQSEGSTGQRFVNYWIHGAFMNVNDDKMAKSKGNFLKLADVTESGIAPLAFRYWLLTAHYRSPINWNIEALKASQTAFVRLIEAFLDLTKIEKGAIEHVHELHEKMKEDKTNYALEFEKAITDDFNMPEALAIAWKLIKDPHEEPQEKVELLLDFDSVFGLGLGKVLEMSKNKNSEETPTEIIALAEAREEARKNKEWDKADALRKEIESRGYIIKDIETGYQLKKK